MDIELEEVPSKPRRGRKKKQVTNVNFISQSSNITMGCITFDEPEPVPEKKIGTKDKQLIFGGLEIKVCSGERHEQKRQITNAEALPQQILYHSETKLIRQEQMLLVQGAVAPEEKPPIKGPRKVKGGSQPIDKSHNRQFTNTLSDIFVTCDKSRVLQPINCKKTDVCCWWCCHKFDSDPCYLPTVTDDITNRFIVIGNFCSWRCVKAYNMSLPNEVTKRLHILRKMLKCVGCNSATIKEAPPRQTLKMFGGHLSIEEFRSVKLPEFNLTSPFMKKKTILLESMHFQTSSY